MSKGSKPATTVTQQQIPTWLKDTLQPLLQGSTSKLIDFQNQGNAVLQGGNYKNVTPIADTLAAQRQARLQRRIDKLPPPVNG